MNKRRGSYHRYIKSNKWGEFRNAILRRYKECSVCGSTENLCLHHLTYENFKNEKPNDVVVLCEICHNKLHLMFAYPTKHEFELFKSCYCLKKKSKNSPNSVVNMSKESEKIKNRQC